MFGRQVTKIFRHGDGCVVEHVVQPPMPRGDIAHRAFDVRCLRHIQGDGFNTLSSADEIGCDLLRGVEVDVGNHHARTVSRELLHQTVANS